MATFPDVHRSITALSYAERQKLVVLPGDELAEMIALLAKHLGTDGALAAASGVGVGVGASVAAGVATASLRTAASSMLINPLLVVALDPRVRRQVKTWVKKWKVSAKAGLGILYADVESADALLFPAGHPVHNLLYIAHPTDPRRYLVAAEFHRAAFQDKAAEAIDLLRALGAKTLTVRHVTGWGREVAISLGSESPTPVDASIGGGVTSSTKSEVLFEASYDPVGPPALPNSLHWYADEPLWQQVARGRLESNLRTFSLDVSYQQDFGVDAEVSAKAQKAGFKLGGEFKRHRATQWRITGEFGAS